MASMACLVAVALRSRRVMSVPFAFAASCDLVHHGLGDAGGAGAARTPCGIEWSFPAKFGHRQSSLRLAVVDGAEGLRHASAKRAGEIGHRDCTEAGKVDQPLASQD